MYDILYTDAFDEICIKLSLFSSLCFCWWHLYRCCIRCADCWWQIVN